MLHATQYVRRKKYFILALLLVGAIGLLLASRYGCFQRRTWTPNVRLEKVSSHTVGTFRFQQKAFSDASGNSYFFTDSGVVYRFTRNCDERSIAATDFPVWREESPARFAAAVVPGTDELLVWRWGREESGGLRVYALASPLEIRKHVHLEGMEGAIAYWIAVSPDGKTIALGGREPVAIFDYPSGRRLGTFRNAIEDNCAKFSVDGEALFLGPSARYVTRLSTRDWKSAMYFEYSPTEPGWIVDIAVDRQSPYIAVLAIGVSPCENRLSILDGRTMNLVAQVEELDSPVDIEEHPAGGWFAALDADGRVGMVRFQDGAVSEWKGVAEDGEAKEEFAGVYRRLLFADGGNILCCVSLRGVVTFWRVRRIFE